MSKTAIPLPSRFLAFAPALVWAGVIYLFSSQQVLPSLTLDTWDFIFKKSAHVFVYAVLYWLLFRAFAKGAPQAGRRAWLVPLVWTLAYALFDEFHQSLVPNRHSSLRDVGFDALGASLVMLRKFGYI
jgi:VanZ family protein